MQAPTISSSDSRQLQNSNVAQIRQSSSIPSFPGFSSKSYDATATPSAKSPVLRPWATLHPIKKTNSVGFVNQPTQPNLPQTSISLPSSSPIDVDSEQITPRNPDNLVTSPSTPVLANDRKLNNPRFSKATVISSVSMPHIAHGVIQNNSRKCLPEAGIFLSSHRSARTEPSRKSDTENPPQDSIQTNGV